jgi:hypothetical protein
MLAALRQNSLPAEPAPLPKRVPNRDAISPRLRKHMVSRRPERPTLPDSLEPGERAGANELNAYAAQRVRALPTRAARAEYMTEVAHLLGEIYQPDAGRLAQVAQAVALARVADVHIKQAPGDRKRAELYRRLRLQLVHVVEISERNGVFAPGGFYPVYEWAVEGLNMLDGPMGQLLMDAPTDPPSTLGPNKSGQKGWTIANRCLTEDRIPERLRRRIKRLFWPQK